MSLEWVWSEVGVSLELVVECIHVQTEFWASFLGDYAKYAILWEKLFLFWRVHYWGVPFLWDSGYRKWMPTSMMVSSMVWGMSHQKRPIQSREDAYRMFRNICDAVCSGNDPGNDDGDLGLGPFLLRVHRDLFHLMINMFGRFENVSVWDLNIYSGFMRKRQPTSDNQNLEIRTWSRTNTNQDERTNTSMLLGSMLGRWPDPWMELGQWCELGDKTMGQ